MKLEAEQLTIFLVSIGVMLLFAKLLGEAFTKIRQPAIIGEITAGIILGPTIFGTILPDLYSTLFPPVPEIQIAMDGITSLAVIMLLLVSGLEVDLSVVFRQGKTAFLTSIMGVIFPFAVGFALTYAFPLYFGINDEKMRMIFALFMGTAMSISALPVIARTLMDLNIFKTDIGLIIIAAAMFNDLIGWIIFSVILGMLGSGSHGINFLERILLLFSFIGFMLILGRKMINKVFPIIQNKFAYPGGVLNFIFILGFLSAAFTEYIGVHAIFGAFIVGITIGDTAHLREKTREIVHQFVTNIFAPLFFVSIGLRVNFLTNFDLMLVVVVLIIAFSGKVIGCGLGAYWGKMSVNESLAIGFGMNSRGAMEIILGLLALQFGLIQEKVFVALVIMALLTSLTSAPFMSYFLRGRKKLSFADLLNSSSFIITSSTDKREVISQLAEAAARNSRLKKEDIIDAVWKREELLPTGIANYLAIPHARIEGINKPLVVMALNKEGIDFEAPDKLPSRIILMLLTPAGKSELQLEMLAEIAEKFKDRSRVEALLLNDSPDAFLFQVRQL